MKKVNEYKWTKPKKLYAPKIKYLVDAWWKELWEGLEKIRKNYEKDKTPQE